MHVRPLSQERDRFRQITMDDGKRPGDCDAASLAIDQTRRRLLKNFVELVRAARGGHIAGKIRN